METATDRLFECDPGYQTIEPAQRAAAKIIGGVYLFAMATGVFGQMFVRGRLMVRGDAGRTAQNISAQSVCFECRSRPTSSPMSSTSR